MKQSTVVQVLDSLEGLSLRDQVEVLANVFLRLGISTMQAQGLDHTDDQITIVNVAGLITKYVRDNGKDTIGSALARQGLTLLIWLDNEEIEDD